MVSSLASAIRMSSMSAIMVRCRGSPNKDLLFKGVADNMFIIEE